MILSTITELDLGPWEHRRRFLHTPHLSFLVCRQPLECPPLTCRGMRSCPKSILLCYSSHLQKVPRNTLASTTEDRTISDLYRLRLLSRVTAPSGVTRQVNSTQALSTVAFTRVFDMVEALLALLMVPFIKVYAMLEVVDMCTSPHEASFYT